jgi:hypothetical protein
MEAVFKQTGLPVEPSANSGVRYANQTENHGEGQAPSQEIAPKRVLRGSYSKGLLVLEDGDEQGLEADGARAGALASQDDPAFHQTVITYQSEINQTNLVLLELVRIHALQAKAANELIIKLSEQLKKSDEYIQVLLHAKGSNNIWWRLFVWLTGKEKR